MALQPKGLNTIAATRVQHNGKRNIQSETAVQSPTSSKEPTVQRTALGQSPQDFAASAMKADVGFIELPGPKQYAGVRIWSP